MPDGSDGLGLVDIVLPSGESATVPQRDLSQAVAAGAHVQTEQEQTEKQIGGLYGQAMTGIIGTGRTATFGLSDAVLGEGANMIGGEGLRKDVLKALSLAKDTNPYSNMAGEAAGLLTPGGVGSGISEGAGAIEAGITGRLGTGLAGRVVGMGARGAIEGALIGEQQQITEDYLGDHKHTGEKAFAAMEKGALFGAGAGAALGAGSYGLSKALGSVRGPASNAVLDEVVGAPGAGAAIKAEAKQAQALIGDLERAGATTEQATKMADEVLTTSRARANGGGGFFSGLVDDASAAYVAKRAGGNQEIADVLSAGYADRASKLAQRAEVLDQHALDLKKIGDRVLRAEDALNDVQFTYKPQQMARLVEPKNFATQRDTLAKLLQDTDDTLRFWESTSAKGGAEGAIKSLRKQHTDALQALAKVENDATSFTGASRRFLSGGSRANASRDFFVKSDAFKRSIDRLSGYGKSQFGLPEAAMHPEMGLRNLGDKWRAALEDEAVWGKAGAAQKEWNASFSEGFARRRDFGGRFSARIDEVRGVPVPEIDAAKVKNGLLKQLGSEADVQQAMKSTEAWMDGNRQRIAAIRKYGELSPAQQAALKDGEAALGEFEKRLGTAKSEGEVIAKIERMQLEEQGKAIGGLMGIGADLITRPLTTVERLAGIKRATVRMEEVIAGGLDRFFSGKGAETIKKVVRPKADVVKEIGEIKQIAANDAARSNRVMSMLGDLPKHAPKIAAEMGDVAHRALTYLAQEAPMPSGAITRLALMNDKPRYSEQDLSKWEAKREAALNPQSVVEDMRRGRVNRDAIRTVKLVYPQMFAEMQNITREHIARLQAEGKLDKMPYETRALVASLLEVPADGTWEPDFIAMMQSMKQGPPGGGGAPPGAPAAAAPPTYSKRAVKMNTAIYSTEADRIERSAP